MPSNTAASDSWPQRFRDKPWLWTLTGVLLAVSAVVLVWSIVNALLHADRQHAGTPCSVVPAGSRQRHWVR